jgi:hypothetical protein
MAAFVTNTQFLVYYDYRLVGQLLVDDNTQPSQAAVITNTNLTAIIQSASGEVISYCARGEIYTEDDLNNLTGNSMGYLQKLTSDIAYYYIGLRRGLPLDQFPSAKIAYETLKQLAEGRQIFDLPANAAAGHASSNPILIQDIYLNNHLTNSVPYFPTNRFVPAQT